MVEGVDSWIQAELLLSRWLVGVGVGLCLVADGYVSLDLVLLELVLLDC